jgi:hypothetical protein
MVHTAYRDMHNVPAHRSPHTPLSMGHWQACRLPLQHSWAALRLKEGTGSSDLERCESCDIRAVPRGQYAHQESLACQ